MEAKQRIEVEPPADVQKKLGILMYAINEICKQNASGLDLEGLARDTQYLVEHNYGEELYSGLVTAMTFRLREITMSIEAARGDLFLKELNRKWVDHSVALQKIRVILRYMDKNFIPEAKLMPVHELGLNLWTDVVIHSCNTQTRLWDRLPKLVHRERTGEVKNRGIRNIIKMLMDLGSSVYQEDFEEHFLDFLAGFYHHLSQKFIDVSCGCRYYLKKAERLLNEEMGRKDDYLDDRSIDKITSVIEKEVIESHMHTLVHMEKLGLVNLLVDDKYEDLRRMYNLFHRVQGGLLIVRKAMTSYIKDTGKQLVTVTDPVRLRDPIDFVQGLLDLKDKYDKIISVAFNNDETFQHALNSSFESFINLNGRSPEFISLYVDDKLRKLIGFSEEGVEIVLDKVVRLFRYLQEKDVFEKYYNQHLAKRLIAGKTASDDAERSVIVKLKTECGSQFTFKMEGMFTDMKTSQDIRQDFYASHGAELGDSPKLAVWVLTTRLWPSQPSATCNLPAEIQGVREKFESYFLGTHTRRRLSWQTNMGTADLKATFGMGQKHELNVSTYQMCILMLFNNAGRLSYKEIEQVTEITGSDLKRCLQSLACVKGKNVLRKEPMSKEIAEDDAFFFNDKFTSKPYRVKIGTVVTQRESEPENQESRQTAEEYRKPIEAAIVRIMKSRQKLDHDTIVTEVTKQLLSWFLPNPIVIKKQIESLIEREYLERDEVDRELYRYLA